MRNPMAQAARPSAPNPCATASSTAPPLPARLPNATPKTALAKVLSPPPDDMAQAARPSAPNPCATASSTEPPLPARLPNATPRTALAKGTPSPTSSGDRDLSGQCRKPPEHVMHKASGGTYIKPDARVKPIPAEDITYVWHGKPFGRTVGSANLQKRHCRLSVTPPRSREVSLARPTPLAPKATTTLTPKATTLLTPKAMAPLTHKTSAPLTHKATTPLTLKATSLGAPCPTSGGDRDFLGDNVKQLSNELEAVPCTKSHIKNEREKKRGLSMSFNMSSDSQCKSSMRNLVVDSPPGFPLDVPPGFTRAHCGLCREETIETHIGSSTGLVLDTPGFSLDVPPGFTAEHCGLNTNGTITPPESDTDEIGTQIFINFGGSSISSQEKLNKLNVEMLMKSTLKRVGVQTNDFYCECSGKYLDKEKLLSEYPIERDSTIKVRPRLRAGKGPIQTPIQTWDQIIGTKPRHHVVPLAPRLIGTKNKRNKIKEARFLHSCIQYNAREILICLCGKHSRGKSLNGLFTSADILFKAGKAYFADHIEEVDFTLDSCRNDYLTTHNIFLPVFWDNNLCGLHAEHLLNFLWTCPAGAHSRSQKVIAFLTNHIALLTFSDRMGICTNLDGMILRLLGGAYMNFLRRIKRPYWKPDVNEVPAMKDVLEFAAGVDPRTGQLILTYSKDGDQPVHFAANFFKHAPLGFTREELEAAFSLAMSRHNYLADLLQAIAMDSTLPPAFDLVELVGHNVLVGMERKEDMVQDDQ